MAAPSYGAASTVVASTTSVGVTCPTTSAGNKLFYFASTNGSAISHTLAGWTFEGEVSGGSPAMREAVFSRDADGTEGGTVYTVTGMTGGTKGVGYIVQLVPGAPGDSIILTPLSAVDSNSASTAVSLTAGSSWTSNTNCIIASSYSGLAPSGTYSGPTASRTVAQTGATISTTTRFGAGFSGNTGAYGFQTGAVTSGGTGTPSFTATTVGANFSGVGWLILAESSAVTDGLVNAVAATATAAGVAPTITGTFNGSVAAVSATATAVAAIPAIFDGSATPTFRDSSDVQGGSTVTALTPTTPATVQVGDMGFVVVVAGGGSGASDPPAGWSTLIASTLLGTGGGRFAIYYRAYQAGDADPTISWPSAPTSGNNTCALAFWYEGVGSVTAGSVSTSTTASTDWTAPSLTTGANHHTVISLSGEKGGGSGWGSIASWSPDAVMRATRYGTGNFYPSVVLGDLTMPTAGSTNAQTATWNYSTNNAFALQIDLAPVGVDAVVNGVAGTATADGLAPTTGSNTQAFAVEATADAAFQNVAVEISAGVSGGGPMIANAAGVAPGVRQQVFVTVQATATAAAIAPTPLGSNNVVIVATAAAEAFPPLTVTGSAIVSAVAATSTSDAPAPGLKAVQDILVALADAVAPVPRIGQSTVQPPAATATADAHSPVVPGTAQATAATATALTLAPFVTGGAVVVAPRATAAAILFLPVVGHREWVLALPTYDMHYTDHPLMKRIGYPTPQSLLLIDGFYQLMTYPDDELIATADKTYLGGYTHIISTDEVNSLVAAGYGDYISQEVFVTP
jgi:hypothetical protein